MLSASSRCSTQVFIGGLNHAQQSIPNVRRFQPQSASFNEIKPACQNYRKILSQNSLTACTQCKAIREGTVGWYNRPLDRLKIGGPRAPCFSKVSINYQVPQLFTNRIFLIQITLFSTFNAKLRLRNFREDIGKFVAIITTNR